MLTFRQVVAASKAAATERGRYALEGVRVNGCAEATDGLMAVRITPTDKSDPLPEMILSRDGIEAAKKLCSKKNMAVGLVAGEDGRAVAMTSQGAFGIAKIEGCFPRFDDILAAKGLGEPVARVTLNAKLLKKLGAVVEALDDDERQDIEFRIYSKKDAPVLVRSERRSNVLEGAIMPVVID